MAAYPTYFAFKYIHTKYYLINLTMKKSTLIFGGILSLIVLVSAVKATATKVDLSEKGIPVVVDAPEGAIIEEGIGNGMEMEGVITHCWEINKGDFSLEVSMEGEEMWQSAEEYVAFSKEFVEMEGFVEYVVSDEFGFIAKMEYDGEIEYDFYHLLVKDDYAIEFAPGLGTSDWSLPNIKMMYNAAKTAK